MGFQWIFKNNQYDTKWRHESPLWNDPWLRDTAPLNSLQTSDKTHKHDTIGGGGRRRGLAWPNAVSWPHERTITSDDRKLERDMFGFCLSMGRAVVMVPFKWNYINGPLNIPHGLVRTWGAGIVCYESFINVTSLPVVLYYCVSLSPSFAPLPQQRRLIRSFFFLLLLEDSGCLTWSGAIKYSRKLHIRSWNYTDTINEFRVCCIKNRVRFSSYIYGWKCGYIVGVVIFKAIQIRQAPQ